MGIENGASRHHILKVPGGPFPSADGTAAMAGLDEPAGHPGSEASGADQCEVRAIHGSMLQCTVVAGYVSIDAGVKQWS